MGTPDSKASLLELMPGVGGHMPSVVRGVGGHVPGVGGQVLQSDTICESAFAVGLKEMVLAGMGVAWLPSGLIEREFEAGLVRTLPQDLASPVLTIAVYRLRNSTYPALDDIWSLLERETPLAS